MPYHFRRWITHEVLPTIRKTGRYEHQPAAPAIPDLSIESALRVLRTGRWLMTVQGSNIVLNPVPLEAYVLTAEEFAGIIRDRPPLAFPASCCPRSSKPPLPDSPKTDIEAIF